MVLAVAVGKEVLHQVRFGPVRPFPLPAPVGEVVHKVGEHLFRRDIAKPAELEEGLGEEEVEPGLALPSAGLPFGARFVLFAGLLGRCCLFHAGSFAA